MKKPRKITPCNPEAVSCCFQNDELALERVCFKCGWNPQEAKRRRKNIRDGKPVLDHWKRYRASERQEENE